MRLLFVGDDAGIQLAKLLVRDEADLIGSIRWRDNRAFFMLKAMADSAEVIIISASDSKLRIFLTNILHLELNVDLNRIIDFYKMYKAILPLMRADCYMKFDKRDGYKGIILGISHAEVGLLTEYFDENYVNLAVSSQDLYYNNQLLEYVYTNYYDRVKNVDKLIIDMFDYTYFNYDVSLSSTAHSYYGWGGYNKDGHNFEENHNYDFSFEEYITYLMCEKYKDISEEMIDIWDCCFMNPLKHDQNVIDQCIPKVWERCSIVSLEDIEQMKIKTSIRVKKFERTWNENIEIIKRIIGNAYTYNPRMKIIFLLMPQYYPYLQKVDSIMGEWKIRFMQEINRYVDNYPIVFWDYKVSSFSYNKLLFQDPSHLNYYGAFCFTKELDKRLNRELR